MEKLLFLFFVALTLTINAQNSSGIYNNKISHSRIVGKKIGNINNYR